MRKFSFLLAAGLFLSCFQAIHAQTVLDSAATARAANKGAVEQKTLTTQDLLDNLYQIAANDLTADTKSIKFKSTIFGLEKIFAPKVNDSRTYSQQWLERYLEPYATFAYKNKFNPSNLSVGVIFSFINANDKTQSSDLNSGKTPLRKNLDDYSAKVNAYLTTLTARYEPPANATMQEKINMSAALSAQEAILTTFARSGDDSKLPPDMKKELTDTKTLDAIKSFKSRVDSLALAISNRWNVTFTPEGSYGFNFGQFQGASFTFNAVKGAVIIPKLSTQFTAKAGYVFGDDTIVKVNAIGRKAFQSSFGFNQVLHMKSFTAADGTSSKVPNLELALAYGYNYLTDGYKPTDKRNQPSLSGKFGILIGSSSWIVFPVSYNYATKTTMASVSLKVTLGDAPFKLTP